MLAADAVIFRFPLWWYGMPAIEDIPFRRQNGGDYPDGHVLAGDVAVGQSGLLAQVADMETAPRSVAIEA